MMKIRLATKKDIHNLSLIYCKAYNTLNIGEHWDEKSANQLLSFFFKEQADLFFVAVEENQVVGCIVAIVKPWWDGNHLADGELFVDPMYQGKKIGIKLIKHLFTIAGDKYKAKCWDTFTHTVHDHPLSWYKKLAFKEIKKWTMIEGNIEDVLKKIDSLLN